MDLLAKLRFLVVQHIIPMVRLHDLLLEIQFHLANLIVPLLHLLNQMLSLLFHALNLVQVFVLVIQDLFALLIVRLLHLVKELLRLGMIYVINCVRYGLIQLPLILFPALIFLQLHLQKVNLLLVKRSILFPLIFALRQDLLHTYCLVLVLRLSVADY